MMGALKSLGRGQEAARPRMVPPHKPKVSVVVQ